MYISSNTSIFSFKHARMYLKLIDSKTSNNPTVTSPYFFLYFENTITNIAIID